IEEAGYALWGYGGNTCHPQSMVQPFARSFEERGHTIYLCMQEMDSKHLADPVRADQFSEDGVTWNDIPTAINVLGSRYALAIKGLRQETLELPLEQTRVAVGSSLGRAGDQYISGRVDKACLEFTGLTPQQTANARKIQINLVAELVRPYAVYL